jgi:type IV secretion system protein VirB9
MYRRARLLAARSVVLALALAVGYAGSAAAQPITTDSRIKTLVYSPNEVFALTTHYGYQSNIEFGPKESIETISVGDRVGWQISPAGRRLFIRAQEENAHTNMTVVTNLRAYQFDLRSSSSDAVFGSEELTYVVRFYYPEENDNIAAPPPGNFSPAPPPPAPMAAVPPAPATASGFNYRYSFSGPPTFAPVKIFDDGKSTFFKFAGNVSPKISVVSANGEALDVPTRRTADGLIAVNVIAQRFSIKQGPQQVFVYNEANGVM